MIAVARQRGERGQGASATFMRKVPEPLRQREMRSRKAAGSASVRHQPRVQQLWIDVGGDIFRADGLAIVEDDADGAVALDDHLAHAGIGFDLGAVALRGARHRQRDRAHAADGVAPDALLAVHLAEGMVQHHIGRARGVGARIIADDGVEAEQRLDEVAFKPLVQHLAGRAGEQIEQAALLLQRQLSQDVAGRRPR